MKDWLIWLRVYRNYGLSQGESWVFCTNLTINNDFLVCFFDKSAEKVGKIAFFRNIGRFLLDSGGDFLNHGIRCVLKNIGEALALWVRVAVSF